MSLEKVIQKIKKNKRFLITSHVRPDGDALGAELAFLHMLKKLGKDGVVVNNDGIPHFYEFLPGAKGIKEPGQIRGFGEYDCFVVLDSSCLNRCGEVSQLFFNKAAILNIDHHVSNDLFADANWVEPKVSSTSEMIYRLYKEMKVAFDEISALLLYVGMLTDTGSFHYSNTSASTHRAVAELLEYGLSAQQIYRKIYESISVSDARFLLSSLAKIKFSADGKIAWYIIEENKIPSRSLLDLNDNLFRFARSIKGVEVAVIFSKDAFADTVRVNFRSQGKVDVNKVANLFGGGGHKSASGATVKGSVQVVLKKVFTKIGTVSL